MMNTPVRPATIRPLPCSALKVSRRAVAPMRCLAAPRRRFRGRAGWRPPSPPRSSPSPRCPGCRRGPVRSDPADDGVDVSLVGRKEHVSHRPCWVVPRPLSSAQRSGLIVADDGALGCRLGVIADGFLRNSAYGNCVYHGRSRPAMKWTRNLACGPVVDTFHVLGWLLTASRVSGVPMVSRFRTPNGPRHACRGPFPRCRPRAPRPAVAAGSRTTDDCLLSTRQQGGPSFSDPGVTEGGRALTRRWRGMAADGHGLTRCDSGYRCRWPAASTAASRTDKEGRGGTSRAVNEGFTGKSQ